MRVFVATVFVAVFAVGAFGSPAVGSDPRCASVESACEDLWSATKCGLTKQCVPRWEQLATPSVGNDTELCALCKQMVQEAKDQLLSNETQSELREVLEGSCDVLMPIDVLNGICKKLMDTFQDEVNDMLVSRMDPTQVCTVSGLCYTSAEKGSKMFERASLFMTSRQGQERLQCNACKSTIDRAVGFTKFVPQETAIKAFIELCERMGNDNAKCSRFAYTYVAKFFQRFNQASSAQSCQALGKCPGGGVQRPIMAPTSIGAPSEDLQCEFCEAMVHKLAAQFNNTSTKSEVKTVLESLCKHTGKWSQECLDKVEKDFDKAYDELISMLDPPKVCTLLGLCNGQSAQAVPLAKLEPATVPDKMAAARLTYAVGQPSQNAMLGDDPLASDSSIGHVAPTSSTLNSTCDTCQRVVHWVAKQLNDTTTENDIIALIEEVCDASWFPEEDRKECRSMTSAYGSLLLHLLVDHMDPDYICAKIHLCAEVPKAVAVLSIRKPVKTEGEICGTCQKIAGYLVGVVTNNDTEESIRAVLENACTFIPMNVAECQNFMDDHIDKLYDLLRKDITVDNICKGLGLCGGPRRPVQHVSLTRGGGGIRRGSDGCFLCTTVAGYVINELKDNRTEAAIIAALQKVCRVVPVDATECQNAINTYGGMIINLIQQDLNADEICAAIGLCGTATPRAVVRRPVNKLGDGCDLCTVVADALLDMIRDNKTDAAITQAVERVCTVIPIDGENCRTFIEAYADELFQFLRQDVSGTLICMRLGLCPTAPRSAALPPSRPIQRKQKLGDNCALCTLVAGYLVEEFKNNSTEAAILASLDKVCSVMPIDATECKNMVNTYVGMLIEYLKQNMTAEEICAAIRLCSAARPAIKAARAPLLPPIQRKILGDNCALCSLVAGYLIDELKNNNSEAAILADLEKVCTVLPMDATECQNIVKTYVGMMFDYIKQNLTPEEICAEIGLCATARRPVKGARAQFLRPIQRKTLGDNCALCSLVAGYLIDELKNNNSEAAILADLEKVCTVLPMDATECQNIVKTYVGMMFDYIKQNLTPEEICAEIGLCATARRPVKRSLSVPTCTLCKMVANYVLQAIENDKTNEAITSALEKACSELPVDAAQCKTLVDKYAVEFVKAIEADLSADGVCWFAGLCSAKPATVRQKVRGDTCALCEVAAQWLVDEVKDNRTEAAITAALEKVCRVIPVDGAECKNFIDVYATDLINLLASEVTPAEICASIGLCATNNVRQVPAASAVRDSQACPMCQIVVNVVEAELRNNNTRAEIDSALEMACRMLPANDQTTCRNMVNVYTGYVIELLETLATPEQICETLGFCPTPPTDTKCEICMFIANFVETELSSNRTETEIFRLLDKVCDVIPNMNVAQCKQTVEQYADMIITLMAQMVPPRKICDEIRLCPTSANGHRRVPRKQLKDEKCSFCKWIVTWVDNKIEDNRTEEVIKDELYKACDLLTDSTECKAMVSDYVDMVVKMLIQYADPEKICEAIGKCPKKAASAADQATTRKDDPPCQLCKYYVQELRDRLKSPATEDAIRKQIDQVCKILPVNQEECDSFAKEYADELIQLILENSDPEWVCEALRACPKKMMALAPVSSKGGANTTGCEYCKLIMKFVSMEVKDEATDAEIVSVVEKVCDYVPVEYRQDCHRMVEIEGLVIVRMLAEALDPEGICEAVKFCPSTNNGGLVCNWCEYSLHYIQEKLYDNATQHEIQRELETMCDKLPKPEMTNECREFVDFYGPSFEVIIAQNLDPSIVCPAIHACPSRGHKFSRGSTASAVAQRRRRSSVRCFDCVSTLRSFRSQPAQVVCQGANPQFRSKCENNTKTVGVAILDAFGSEYKVCQLAQACSHLGGSFKCNQAGCRHVM